MLPMPIVQHRIDPVQVESCGSIPRPGLWFVFVSREGAKRDGVRAIWRRRDRVRFRWANSSVRQRTALAFRGLALAHVVVPSAVWPSAKKPRRGTLVRRYMVWERLLMGAAPDPRPRVVEMDGIRGGGRSPLGVG